MDPLKSVTIPSTTRIASIVPRPPQALVEGTPQQPEVRGDSVSIAAVPLDAPQVAEQPLQRAETAAPPATLTMDDPEPVPQQHDGDTAFILQAFNGHALESSPEMDEIRSRIQLIPSEVRSAMSMHLLDVLTNPSPDGARQQLSDISSTLGWAQKFKKDSRAAAESGGFEAVMQQAAAAAKTDKGPQTLLDGVIESDSLLYQGKLGDDQKAEANNLLEQFQAGNPNPGIGTSTLGKGVSYLRGRRGTRIFYRMEGGKPQWLAVTNKGSEQQAINMLRNQFDLR